MSTYGKGEKKRIRQENPSVSLYFSANITNINTKPRKTPANPAASTEKGPLSRRALGGLKSGAEKNLQWYPFHFGKISAIL